LVADIPVGIFLSAGIDSNVVASLAAEGGAKLRTVTLAFDEYKGTSNDEAPLAEMAAKILGSDHVTVRIGKDDFEGALDHFFAHMDQPSIDGLNTYLVSRAASSQGLKVALSGLGGDELFGGYPSFHQIPWLGALGRAIPAQRRLGTAIQRILGNLSPHLISPKVAGLIKYAENVGSAYFLRRAVYLIEELDELLDESWFEEGLNRLATVKTLMQSIDPICIAGGTPYAQTAALESTWYMRNQLLRDSDWAGMAHGVEIRVPYVDTSVLDCLAPAIASKSPPSKKELAACAVKLPSEMLTRQKTGFVTPVRDWIAQESGPTAKGLRGWADNVHKRFRTKLSPILSNANLAVESSSP
jgi:asparagine synthase (glutamine-hydrolysing)